MTGVLITLINILNIATRVFSLAIFVYCIMSWIPQLYNSKFGYTLTRIVEPAVRPFSRFLQRFSFFRNIPIDFGPWLLMITLSVASEIILGFLSSLVYRSII